MVFLFLAVLLADAPPAASATLPLRPYLAQQSSLQATVNGVTGTFLFDTGEGVTAITPGFARRIGCRPWGRITGFRMSGERSGNPHCDGLAFRVGSTQLDVPSAIVFDIDALLGAGTPPIDGAIGLDAFSGRSITVMPRSCIVVETPRTLRERTQNARPLPIREVRDAEGVALAVDAAVPTPDGMAWMELDNGNGGSNVIANHIAPLLGLAENISVPEVHSFALANGIVVAGPTRTRDLIMDGNIGARFLNGWNLTLDFATSTAWLTSPTTCNPLTDGTANKTRIYPRTKR
jgi:hypothetical protein